MRTIIKKITIIILVLFICVPQLPSVPDYLVVEASSTGIHDMDQDEFEYPGNPKLIEYDASKSVLEWAFDSITRFVDYILGFLFTFVKILFVGLTEQTENLIDSTISTVQNGTTNSNDDEKTHYTIEDLVYNRIPLFDVNVFTNTPGGKTLPSGSPVLLLRQVVASWYVIFRNLAFVVLLLLLIYTGIRISLTQIAEKKADAKKQLIEWLKAMVLLFVIHLIIYCVLQIGDWLVSIFESGASSENILYNTIKTRAYDMRLSVALPAVIMYIALFIFWLRFLLIYIRRLFKVFMLIAIAPFSVAKYALDNANGKGKLAFDNWLSELVSNVALQAVHALEYSVLMGIAVDIANKSIMGFIIALIFMSQMLKVDKYILALLRFSGKGGVDRTEPLKAPFRETIQRGAEGYLFARAIFRPTVALATGAVKTVGAGIDEISNTTLNVKPIKTVKKKIQSASDTVLNKKDIVLRDTIKKIIKDPSVDEYYKLKIASRARNEKGDLTRNAKKAKKILKKYNETRKQRYSATTGKLKGLMYGASAALVAPALLVHNTEAGLTLLTGHIEKSQKSIKQGKDKAKTQGELDDLGKTIVYVNQANKSAEEIEKTYRNYTGERKERAKQEIEKIEKLNSNSQFIKDSLERYMMENNVDHIDENNVEKILSESLNRIDTTGILTQKEREEIINKQKDEISKKYEKNYKIYRSFRFNGQEERNASQKDERTETQKAFDEMFEETVEQNKAEQENANYERNKKENEKHEGNKFTNESRSTQEQDNRQENESAKEQNSRQDNGPAKEQNSRQDNGPAKEQNSRQDNEAAKGQDKRQYNEPAKEQNSSQRNESNDDVNNNRFNNENSEQDSTRNNYMGYDTEWISKSFGETITKQVVSKENKYIADKINEIKDINSNLEKIGQKKIIDTGKFVKQINKPKDK